MAFRLRASLPIMTRIYLKSVVFVRIKNVRVHFFIQLLEVRTITFWHDHF